MAGFNFGRQFDTFEENIDGYKRTQDVTNNGYSPQPSGSARIRYRRPKKFDIRDKIKAYTLNNTLECMKLGQIVLVRNRDFQSQFKEVDVTGQEDIQAISKILLQREGNTGLNGDAVKCFIDSSINVDYLTVPSQELVFERNKRTGGLFTTSKRTMKDIFNLKLEERSVILLEGKRETSLTTEDGMLIRQCRLIILDNIKEEEHFYHVLNLKFKKETQTGEVGELKSNDGGSDETQRNVDMLKKMDGDSDNVDINAEIKGTSNDDESGEKPDYVDTFKNLDGETNNIDIYIDDLVNTTHDGGSGEKPDNVNMSKNLNGEPHNVDILKNLDGNTDNVDICDTNIPQVEQKKKRNLFRRFLSRTRKSARRIFVCGRKED